jgi:hypothetical protein
LIVFGCAITGGDHVRAAANAALAAAVNKVLIALFSGLCLSNHRACGNNYVLFLFCTCQGPPAQRSRHWKSAYENGGAMSAAANRRMRTPDF